MPIQSPPIAGPAYDDIAGRTERLARAFTKAAASAPWAPAGVDAGIALVRVFSGMMDEVKARLNRVPDRNFLAFLDLVGVEPAPPRPARVPLTFTLVERGDAAPVIAAGTRVAAAPLPGDARDVVFETTAALPTTRVGLTAVLVRQPNGDVWADRTRLATGQDSGTFEALGGDAAVEHALYVAAPGVLDLPAGTVVKLSLALAAADVATWAQLHDTTKIPPLADDPYYALHQPPAPLIVWSYSNGDTWKPLSPTVATGTASCDVTFTLPADMAEVPVDGSAKRWVRAVLQAWPKAGPPPPIVGVTASATVTGAKLVPEAALSSGRPVDLSMDFYPLGERPGFADTFAVASAAALSHAGADVTVEIQTSLRARATLPGTTGPSLVWEVSSQRGWHQVATTTSTVQSGAPVKNDAFSSVSFPVPSDVGTATLSGRTATWLRVRISSGDFTGNGIAITDGKVTDDSYRPPVLASILLDYTWKPSVPAECVTKNDFAFARVTGKFTAFTRALPKDAPPALYLGFTQRFANAETILYLQVAPLSPDDAASDAVSTAPPRVVWEYAQGTGWAPLGADDQTRGFAESGLLRFLGPADLGKRAELGRELYWIRGRLDSGAFPAMPRIGQVLTNTIWATHTTTLAGEVLGSSDGSAGQSFTLVQRPVLEGQRIEVREPSIPSPAERAAIERAEGPDAVTLVGDPNRPDEIWIRWHEVPDFYASGPRDRHYRIDRVAGVVSFGDGRRGMPPPRGKGNVRAALYRTGGGADGNRPAESVAQLKTTVPYVDRVTNHEPATGGADAEGVDAVKDRGPRTLRHGGRAVAAVDCEDLARAASPVVARARAITASFDPSKLADDPAAGVDVVTGLPGAGGVVLLIVPSTADMPPTPSAALLRDVQAYLDARDAPAVGLRVAGPEWTAVSVTDLAVVPTSLDGAEALRGQIQQAITRFLHPLTGNFDGAGWDFGQLPHPSDIYRLVGAIPGVDSIRALTMSPTTPPSARGLVYSGTHFVHLVIPPGGP